MKTFFLLLPKNLISHFVGILMHLKLPAPLDFYSIRAFANFYKINVSEAEKSMQHYKSIGDYFVRRLKPEVRRIAKTDFVHPCDSVITQFAVINEGKLIQAKKRKFSIEELLMESGTKGYYEGGLFATYYLCPLDYHRVHSPVSGTIRSVIKIPGTLWPVNFWSMRNVKNLYSINDRMVVEIETKWGLIKVVFVGATNVGKITLAFDGKLVTNDWDRECKKVRYEPGIPIKRGDELGVFHMGSTVILIVPKEVRAHLPWAVEDRFRSQKVQMGQALL